LEWIEKAHPEFKGRWKVFVSDARTIDKLLPAESVGAIVAEPFLGPPQNGRETPEQLKHVMNDELVTLYRDAIASLSKLLARADRRFSHFLFSIATRARSLRLSLKSLTASRPRRLCPANTKSSASP